MSGSFNLILNVFAALLDMNFIEVLKRTDNIEIFNQDGNFVIAFNVGQPDLVNTSIKRLASLINKTKQENPQANINIHYDKENHILTFFFSDKDRAELEKAFPSEVKP